SHSLFRIIFRLFDKSSFLSDILHCLLEKLEMESGTLGLCHFRNRQMLYVRR
ncbi:unnamed protein product, partial [Musa hybrid cultivar]